MSTNTDKITIPALRAMKRDGRKISCLTAYDYPTARLLDRVGIELILVGDSAAMCVLGHDSTLTITMDEMVTLCAAVSRGADNAFVVGDLPFMSYQPSDRDAVLNAGRLMAEGAVDAVKLEGGERMADRVSAITDAGIPCVGHVGLTPQSYTQLGGYRSQGRTAESALQLVRDAEALEAAGAFLLVVEAVPEEIGAEITRRLSIPVLSVGGGPSCDGQLVTLHDMLGLFDAFTPRFVRRYAEVGEVMLDAFARYRADVRTGNFPGPEHQYPISEDELKVFHDALAASGDRSKPSEDG